MNSVLPHTIARPLANMGLLAALLALPLPGCTIERNPARNGATAPDSATVSEAAEAITVDGLLGAVAALSRDSILNPLHAARFYAPSGAYVSYTSPRPEAVAVDRLLFDDLLLGAARDAGADLMFGRRVDDVRVGGSGATVRFRDGSELRARVCVLACGAHYVL